MGKFGKQKQKRFMCKAFFACKLLHFKGPRPPFFTDELFFAQLWTLSIVP